MRKQLKITRKVVKRLPKVSRSEQYLVNLRYLGEEPLFAEILSDSQLMQSLSWYHKMCNAENAREYLTTFLKDRERTLDSLKLEKIQDAFLPLTACWVARMITQGNKIKEDELTNFEEILDATFKNIVLEEEKPKENVISIRDRVRERTIDLIGEIEEMIDQNESFSLYTYLQRKEIPRTYVNAVASKYAETIKELESAFNGNDDQLVEAYSYMPRTELKKRIAFFKILVEDATRYAHNVKTAVQSVKQRKPRASKNPKLNKKMQFMTVQSESSEHKVTSISTQKIIGASELWAFNTIYKSITVLRALDKNGLDINRSSVINIDEKNSYTKRVGRKTALMLDKVLNLSKNDLKKEYELIKTNSTLQTRMNENTILLRVF